MKKAVIAALALVLGASAVARADQVIVLNSEEASYSILSRGLRMETQRLPLGREPHHLIQTPDGKELLIASTVTNELVSLDTKTGERKRTIRGIIDRLSARLQPGRQVVRDRGLPARSCRHLSLRRQLQARRPHLHRRHAEPHGVRQRFQDGVRHPAAEREGRGVRPADPARSSGTRKSARRRPARSCCPTTSACWSRSRARIRSSRSTRRTARSSAGCKTGKGAHNFWPKGDGRHWFLSNRVEGTVSLIDTQDMQVVAHHTRSGRPGLHGHHARRQGAVGDAALPAPRRDRRPRHDEGRPASIPIGKSPHGVFILKAPAVTPPPVRAASTEPAPK